MTVTYVQPTAAQWKRLERKIANIDAVHSCSPEQWLHRVQSPGFNPGVAGAPPGTSMWTCPVCEQMKGAVVAEVFGSYETKKAGEK